MRSQNGRVKYYFLGVVALLIIAILRIVTLGIPVDLPRQGARQNGYYDYEGVIHWHTGFTGDAFGTYKDLARIGNQFHIDFLITTEHNNLLALEKHQEGWYGNMLTLVGIESSRKEGYLLGFNLLTYTTREAPTSDFLSEAAKTGGFAIIAHPKNPRWRWRGDIDGRIVGQEIIDLTDQFNTASPWAILKGILYFPFNAPAAFIQVYRRPDDTLKMWDEETSQRHFTGIYAADAHQSIRLLGRHLVAFPKADAILPIAHNHVILSTPFTGDLLQDKAMLYDAIKKGRVYVAIDSLQDARGFFFSAQQGDKTVWMGDELPAGIKTAFAVKLPQPLGLKNTVINVFHNGEKIASQQGSSYAFQAMLPGAYRVEVECEIPTFLGLKKNVVWVYSNPIYLR